MNPLKLTNGWIREFFLMLTFTGGFCGALIGESPEAMIESGVREVYN
ncbi:hypothetical protein F0726_01828 [Acidithiobacillus caldus]|jgi:hypothetical protein|nr:hypothetical protein F0726_01828 [Acidithiobacillus caldus]